MLIQLLKHVERQCLLARSVIRRLQRTGAILIVALLCILNVQGANETLSTGAFIINMGVTPQTVANGLKPYGLLHDVIKNNDVPVKWVIGQSKIKDGIDFTYNGISYRGGTFIIPAEFRSAAVNAKIANWQAQGVVGATTTTPLTVNVTLTLKVAPYWAMDDKNGRIAIDFLTAAGIPASAYYYRTPATLNVCDELYVMPHADPDWSTHSNLYFWNKNYRGGIWAGCHAISVMEGPDCVNPGNPAQNLKFLTTGGLVRFTQHANGTPPYSYMNYTDPVFQFMGIEDGAHSNGSEKIYMPLKVGSNWHAGFKVGCYDPTQSDIPAKSNGPAVLTGYGRAFNDTTRGFVMYQSGHNIGGSSPENVAAQRQFFNWSFLVSTDKAPVTTFTNIPPSMNGGQLYNNLTANPVSPIGLTVFTYEWSSSIGGVFSAPTSQVTNFTPPGVGSITSAVLTCKVKDQCGRTSIDYFTFSAIPGPVAPVAVNDTVSYSNLCAAIPTTLNVLTNDSDINGNMVNSITFVGGGNYGTFTNNGNGSVTYTPGWNFLGTDTMRYQVCDGTPLCSQAKIVIRTNFSGNCSISQYQRTDSVRASAVTHQDGITGSADALGSRNATDGSNANTAQFGSNNDSLTLQLDSMLVVGDTLRLRLASDNNNCIDFTVLGSETSTGFVAGVNSMNFNVPINTAKIHSDYLFIATDTVRYIRIKIINTACDNKINLDNVRAYPRQCHSGVPTARVDNVSTGENTAVTTNVRTNDTDPRFQALTVTILTQPANGTAGVNGAGNIVYTPDNGFVGGDQLVYVATNTTCMSDTAIVYYSVTDNPCASNLIGTYHSGFAASVPGSLGVTNPNNALGIADATNGSNASTAIIDNAIGNYIILDLNDTVPASDTIVIRMSVDAASATTVTVEGNLTNAWGAPSTSSNIPLPGIARTYNNYNFIVAGQTRYIRIRQINTNVDVDVDAMNFNFWLCSAIPNRAPVAFNDTASTYSNRAVSYDVTWNDSDPDSNAITVSVIGPAPGNGSAITSGNNIVYTPNFGFTGTNVVTYRICDNGVPSLCDTAIMTVTVLPGPPVAMTDNTSINTNTNVNFNVQANDTLAVTAYIYTTALKPSILSPSNGTAILVGNNIQYTPNADFSGIDSLAYEICDNGVPSQCDTAIFYISVMNQAPVANADAATTSACNSVIVNVLTNDTDPENGELTITSVSVPTSGTAVISNNQIVYTPEDSPVFTGVATFTYTVCDSGYTPLCSVGNVTITINMVSPPSNPPNAVDDIDSTNINQDLYIQVLDNDTDPDNDSLEVDTTAVGLQAPANGTIEYMGNNFIRYIPTYNFQGLDSFEYKVCDIHPMGAGCINITPSCSVAKVYVTVSNRPPAANDDYYSTITTVPINGSVALNDVEPDSQAVTYTVITGPVTGVLVMNNDGTFTFTPDGVFIGEEVIVYQVCDGSAIPLCDTAVLTIYIDITNVEPNPGNDTIVTYGVTPYNGDVSTNDMDPNGNMDPNGFSLLTGPTNGTFIFNNDGTFTYTAYNGFIGEEYVFYEVCDTFVPELCNTATLVIIVPDSAPVTVSNAYSVNEDVILNVNAASGIISNGDFDPNGTTLTVDTTPVVNTSNGVVTISANGSFTYTPDTNFNGTDMFIVNVCDSTGMCTQDTINITINAVNDQVTIVNDNASTNEDVPLVSTIITAGDFDTDTTTLIVNTVPVSGPSNGGIVIDSAGNYTYTPDPGFNGSDMVVFAVCDSGTPMPATCANDTLFITVNGVNDAPVIANDNFNTNEDTPFTGNILTAGDYDTDSTTLSTDTVALSGPANGSITIGTNGAITYTPDPDFNGVDTVIINVCDSGNPLPAVCVADTVIFTVAPVNDPIVVANSTANTNEETPVNGNIITAGDYDPDTTVLVVNTTPVSGPSNGIFVIDNAGNYTYTPDSLFNGTDTIVITICDGGTPLPVTCDNDTLIITVGAFNNAPLIANDTIGLNEDDVAAGSVINGLDSDPDGTTLTADTVPVAGPSNGSIIINSDGTYIYTPDPDFNGPDFVVISVCDSGLPLPAICVNDTLFINVLPVNDATPITNDVATTNEDTPVGGNIITVLEVDPDTTTLVVNTTPVSGPSNGSIIIDSVGNYTYTPDPDFNGTDIIIIQVCDSGNPLPAICANDTLVITVNAVNDQLVIVNDAITTNEGVNAVGSILTAGDYDPDSTTLVVDTVPLSGPSHGTITMSVNGSYTYTPTAFFNGLDTVIFNVCDGGTPLPVTCESDTLFITVNSFNNTPVISNDAISTNEDTPVNGTVITGTDYDLDSTALTANTTPVYGPSNGLIVIASDGSYTYTPSADFNGIDTVIISVCDAGLPLPAICVNDTLIITVNPVNDNPVATDDNSSVCSGSSVQVSVLINDSDVDLDNISITSVVQPANGSVTTDGTTVTYTPNAGYLGLDSLVYNICDDGVPQLCANATVYITVNGITSAGISSTDAGCRGDSSGTVTTSPVGSSATYTYSWSNGATTQNITGVPAGVYTVTITDSLGCAFTDSATVGQPAAGISAIAIPVDVNCFGGSDGSVSLATAGGTAPYTYLWNTTDTSQNISNVSANNYSVIITDANGCTYTISATVGQPAAPLTVTGVTTPANCFNGTTGTVDITVTGGTSNYTYSWSTTEVTEDIAAIAGTYSVIVTDANGCSDSSSYVISDNSVVTLTASGSTTFCAGDSAVLSSSATNGTYQWMLNGSPIGGAIGTSYTATQSGTYSLVNVNGCGTYTSNDVIISVTALPVVTISGGQTICEGASTQLSATGATTYSWSPSAGLDDASISNPIATPLATTTYTVTGTTAGCSNTATINIVVNPVPVVVVTQTEHNCETGTQLNASGGNGYIWTPSTGLDTINIATPVATPMQTTVYTVTVSNANSCASTATVTVLVDCSDLFIPDGFSPDGDGVNDLFVIDGLEYFANASLSVFNRWGNLVYSMENYDNSWDGSTNNGGLSFGSGKVQEGTYFYVLTPGGGEAPRSGYIIVKY